MTRLGIFIAAATFICLAVIAAITLWPEPVAADGALPLDHTTGQIAIGGGVVVDGHGPLEVAGLGPVTTYYAECNQVPCMIRLELNNHWHYIIVSPTAPRG